MGRTGLEATNVAPAPAWSSADASSGKSHSRWFSDFVNTPGGGFVWGIVGSMVGTFFTTLIVLAIGFIRIHGYYSWMEPAAKLAKPVAKKLRQCSQIWGAEDDGSQASNLQALIDGVEGSNRAVVEEFQKSKQAVMEEVERAGMATARSLEQVAEQMSELRYAVTSVRAILADFNNVGFLEEQQWRKNADADSQNALIRSPSRRGQALLFSMHKDRLGPLVVDESSVRTLAGAVGFDVRMHLDYTADQIRHLMGEVAQYVWATDACFLCCVNAYGGVDRDGQHFILGSGGGRLLVLRDIVEPISNCASLVGKPKVFFINISHNQVVQLECDTTSTMPLGSGVVEQQCSAPHDHGDDRDVMQQQWDEDGLGKEVECYVQNAPDCLLLISGSQNSVSSRGPGKHTNFVNALVDGIVLHRQTRDLFSIALGVSKFVVNTTEERCPIVVSSLRKPLYWRDMYS